MKFVDEATIRVEAGNGGHGCLSFRREKYIPHGGPDGGDGGDGADIYLVANPAINTLMEFRYRRLHRAENGQPGMGRMRRGKSGSDLYIPVPVGTTVYDAETEELIGDLVEPEATLCVAKGGVHGIGNTRYKSSVNRAPRQFTKGKPGEQRMLKLELKVLADVGLLGLPNAGKSTFIRAVSNATPKVANYPFTTLNPELGVVNVDGYRSFVIADIPGLVEGASEGVGLGIRFLKHLSRTHLLLHIVDIAPMEGDPVDAIQSILRELESFDSELAEKERWLVFNKIDALSEDEVNERCDAVLKALNWTGPYFKVSAISQKGTKALSYRLMDYIEESKR